LVGETINGNPYQQFRAEDLILRDILAIDRTILANERTLLAYSRTALGLIILGITMLNFSKSRSLILLGILCIPAGIMVGVFGYLRYRKMASAISAVRKSLISQSSDVKPSGIE